MITVLYVDDEPGLLELGKFFLEEEQQFSVDIISSAPAALTLINTKNYDAIISDYQMPGMDGIEFLKKLRASGNTIPFILFTGKGREEVVIQALNEGADFYLQKGGEPVSQFTELAHKIRQAVQQRRAEISIRDLKRREADIINFLPGATFAIDTNGIVITWNHAMEKMTGIRAAQILGKGDYEYALPFYRTRRPVLIDLVLKNDPAAMGEYQNIIRDQNNLIADVTIPHFNNGNGASFWFIASPLYDTRGTIIGAIESIRETTARKKVEEELLRKNEELYAAYEELTTAEEELRKSYNKMSYSQQEFRPSEERYRNVVEDRTGFICRFRPGF
jgi:CheY-like chemotaxis protein